VNSQKTYQTHCTISQSGDLRSILAQLCGRQLGLACDLADDFLYLVHDVVYCVDVEGRGGVRENWKKRR
jgi:hypothetical protein